MSQNSKEKPLNPGQTPLVLEHEYDGIQEYDNPLPAWWVNIFWATFAFTLGYFFHYHLSPNGQAVADEYAEEMRGARELAAKRSLGESVNEAALQKLALDAALMSDAQQLFQTRCAPCHGARGEGVIGPNLTDSAWIHGKGMPMDVFALVDQGVADKGMPAWGKLLTPIELRKVVAFVTTLRNTNLPGKAAEGTPAP